MDFWATINVLFRRWYVAVPILLLTIGATAAMYSSIPKRYVTHAVVVLTQPVTGSQESLDPRDTQRTNPLINFQYGLSQAATVVIQVVNTPGIPEEILDGIGQGATVEVNNGSLNAEDFVAAPFIVITGTAGSPTAASEVTRRALERCRDELQATQRRMGAAPSTDIVFSLVVPPTTAVAPTTDAKRPIAAVLALGIVVMLAGTFGIDSMLVARARMAHRAGQANPPADDAEVRQETGNVSSPT